MLHRRRFVSGLLLAGVAGLVGCKSNGASMGSESAMAGPRGKAVLVNDGHGGSTVYTLVPEQGAVATMSTDGAKECPQCKADANEYFKTGKLDPVCSVCGGHRSVIAPISPH